MAAPLAWLLGGLSFLVYAWTAAARGLPWGDGAEIAAGMRLLAPVHAPGYPLHLLLGRLVGAVVGDPVRAAALLSAAAGAAAVGLAAEAGRSLTRSTLAGAAGALALALAPSFVETASSAEVYALALALLAASYLAALAAAPPALLGLLLGLACAAHTSTALLLPFFAWHLWTRDRPAPDLDAVVSVATGRAAAGLALGLAAFLALWARGVSGPVVFQWPPVETLADLVETATGARFRDWVLAAPAASLPARLVRLVGRLVVDLSIVGVPLAILGGMALARCRRDAVLLLGGATVPVLHALTYGARDPEQALFPAYAALALLVAAGANALAHRAAWDATGRAALAGGVAASSIAVGLVFSAGSPAGASSLPRDTAEAVVEGFPAGARLYAHWPAFTVVRYLQTVEGRGDSIDLWYAEPGGEIRTRRADGSAAPETGPLASTLPRDGRAVCVTWVDTEVGARGYLVPFHGVWRVSDVPPPNTEVDLPPAGRTAAAPGLDFVRVERVPLFARGRPAEVALLWARGEGAGAFAVFRLAVEDAEGDVVYRVPFVPLHAHDAPGAWRTDRAYVERIPVLIPRSSRRGTHAIVLEGPDGSRRPIAKGLAT